MLGVLTQPFYLLSKPNSPLFGAPKSEIGYKITIKFAYLAKKQYVCTLFHNDRGYLVLTAGRMVV